MIRGVILDWGGVICEDPSLGFIQYCAQKLRIDAPLLAPSVKRHLPAFMNGLPEMQFWSLVCHDSGIATPTRALWGEALAAVYRPLDITLSVARQLAAQGIRLGLLTNTEPPSKIFHLAQDYEFFHGRVFSCDEALSKPDPAIYLLASQRIGVPAAECLMVDDRAENITGAKQVGMQTYLFTTPEAFAQDMVALFPHLVF